MRGSSRSLNIWCGVLPGIMIKVGSALASTSRISSPIWNFPTPLGFECEKWLMKWVHWSIDKVVLSLFVPVQMFQTALAHFSNALLGQTGNFGVLKRSNQVLAFTYLDWVHAESRIVDLNPRQSRVWVPKLIHFCYDRMQILMNNVTIRQVHCFS